MGGQVREFDYVLGSTEAEHERLIRQAERLDPFTRQLFQKAGMGTGQRILDIGSGVGDVAILAARIVGPSGHVIGIERDERSITRANARVAEAGLQNVTFLQCDVHEIPETEWFDGAVGRFILQFLSEPASVLCSLAKRIRPGGIMAFHEPSWSPFLRWNAQMPLRSLCSSLIHQTFHCSGATTDMEMLLYRGLTEACAAMPTLWMEMPMGADSFFTDWVFDLFCTVRPQMDQYGVSYQELGDLATLRERLCSEMVLMEAPGACIGLVAAWARVRVQEMSGMAQV